MTFYKIDYSSVEDMKNAIMKIYEMDPEDREKLGQKSRDYVLSEFGYQTTVDLWHDSLKDTIENWKEKHQKWVCRDL